jgi:TrmH family RNA methyltransferase
LFLEGARLVAEALRSDVAIRVAMVTSEGMARDDIRLLADRLDRGGAEVISVPPAVMSVVSGVRSPSPIVALADRPLPPADRIYSSPSLIVIAVDVQDPGNMGAIVRVAEAAGATGVIGAGSSADPYSPKALRGSMGSALRLPIAEAPAAAAIGEAKRHGCRVLATVPRAGRPVFDLDLIGSIALLIGGEGAGLPTPLIDVADEAVTIPMRSGVESLNAAVTAAVVLYEAYRQRHFGKAGRRL